MSIAAPSRPSRKERCMLTVLLLIPIAVKLFCYRQYAGYNNGRYRRGSNIGNILLEPRPIVECDVCAQRLNVVYGKSAGRHTLTGIPDATRLRGP